MTKILKYKGKYLSPNIVESCFVKNKITSVDKVLCGNGFSTACLTLKPVEGKLNIIIAPNKAVVLSKEVDYNKGILPGDNKIKFFYMESTEADFKETDILFFVADSFLMMKDKVFKIKNLIDKVLVDEFHSIEIQSLFRKNLVDFPNKVRELCSDKRTSIVTVTATPNLFSKVDIKLKPDYIEPIDIVIEHDKNETMKRIKEDLNNDEEVVIFTNSARNVYGLKDLYGIVEARFIVGTTFLQSLFELVRIEEKEDSNLTIVSGRGFEGFNIHYKNANVYFLEDRSQPFQTFYLSNLYQALSRTRSGAKYIEYCRQELSCNRTKPFRNIERSVDKFINNDILSVENKQKKEYMEYRPFVVFTQNSQGVFTISKNQAAIDLFEESLLYDKLGSVRDFDEFLKDRKITLIPSNNLFERITTKVSENRKVKNLYFNREIIEKHGVFGEDFTMNPEIQIYQAKNSPLRENYLKYLKTYLRRKNYDQNYDISDRQYIALSILGDQGNFNRLSRRLVKTYNERSILKFGMRGSAPYRREFKLAVGKRLCQLVIMFANERISAPSRWIANRDYNLMVSIGIDEIMMLSKVFETRVQEIDIKSCFPRVLYALSGLDLPLDFYGKDKKNKLKINIALNDFFYDYEKSTPKKMQKRNAKRGFKKFGLDKVVIKYLFEKFFETNYKGDLFNLLSFHEKRLITDVKRELKELGHNDGVIRRHDSVIIFNNAVRLTFLNDLKFLKKDGWLDVPDTRSKAYEYQVDLIFKINENIPF